MTRELPFPQSLTEKYRPKRVSDFIGLVKPKRILEAFIKKPFDSAWLFIGPSGLGKTAMGLAIGDELHAELHKIPSQTCDLDTVDKITRMCQSKAFNFQTGRACAFHLILADELDRATNAAQISLLSKLDATAAPPETVFVFTANSKLTLEDRLLSRLRQLEFTPDSVEGELAGLLRYVYRKEGGKHPLDFEAIAKISKYNVRDALTKLELELLIGNDRKGLPSEDLKILPEHLHECEKCGRPWRHAQLKCKLPHVSVCPSCGGVVGKWQAAGHKAHQTLAKKTIEKYEAEKKAARKKGNR